MIKSIKLANSYDSTEVGFVAKDLSKLYNLDFNVNFSIILLSDFFEQLIRDNTIQNKIYSLLRTLNKKSSMQDIEEVSEKLTTAIMGCELSEDLKDNVNDAYETLPWKSNPSAKDLLGNPQHKINIIASPDYITIPIIKPGVEKDNVIEKIKEVYAQFFSVPEILYRINSNVNEEFSIAIIIQRQENFSVSAFSLIDRIEDKIKVYVFPGKINPAELIAPDENVKPDKYEIVKDNLRLITSVAGKQAFKNIDDNGNFKRVECQIKNFILNDAAGIEIARLTKKAASLLEKKAQIIFEIKNDTANIMYVSNLLDLQEEYNKKSKGIILEGDEKMQEPVQNEKEIKEHQAKKENNIDVNPNEFSSEVNEIEDNYDKIKDNAEKIEELKDEIEDDEEAHEDFPEEIEEKEKELPVFDDDSILNSNKPLNEIIEDQKQNSYYETEKNTEANDNEEEVIEEENQLNNYEKEKVENTDEPVQKEEIETEPSHEETTNEQSYSENNENLIKLDESTETNIPIKKVEQQDNFSIIDSEPIDVINEPKEEKLDENEIHHEEKPQQDNDNNNNNEKQDFSEDPEEKHESEHKKEHKEESDEDDFLI